uniref:Ovule protein n=1 Tax=Parastrongyloides trichosuri TaxID=131310 RepID=A0A0N4ZC47_PARTI
MKYFSQVNSTNKKDKTKRLSRIDGGVRRKRSASETLRLSSRKTSPSKRGRSSLNFELDYIACILAEKKKYDSEREVLLLCNGLSLKDKNTTEKVHLKTPSCDQSQKIIQQNNTDANDLKKCSVSKLKESEEAMDVSDGNQQNP